MSQNELRSLQSKKEKHSIYLIPSIYRVNPSTIAYFAALECAEFYQIFT